MQTLQQAMQVPSPLGGRRHRPQIKQRCTKYATVPWAVILVTQEPMLCTLKKGQLNSKPGANGDQTPMVAEREGKWVSVERNISWEREERRSTKTAISSRSEPQPAPDQRWEATQSLRRRRLRRGCRKKTGCPLQGDYNCLGICVFNPALKLESIKAVHVSMRLLADFCFSFSAKV